MAKYSTLVSLFQKHGCELLSCEADIETAMKEKAKRDYYYVKVKYVAKCGHTREG